MSRSRIVADVLVLGAGGAALMCAATAGQRGKRVVVIDHNDAPGKKILISGGGRCNFTNIHTRPECFLSANPHFAKSALSRYKPHDFIDLMKQYGIAWHEKVLGQLFCDGSARQIVSMLMDECGRGGVEVRLNEEIVGVKEENGSFSVESNMATYQVQSLVIATGGPSIPKLGATDFAYKLARQFKLKVVEPRPALVPLTLGGEDVLFRDLSGVSADVVVSADKTQFAEAALFTHKGLSGPAILQISSYWRNGEAIDIDFCPADLDGWLLEAKHAAPRSTIEKQLAERLPARLAGALNEKLAVNTELANVSDAVLTGVEQRLANWSFHPNGTEGFAKAEVTVGGVSTDELSSKTMESRNVPGLYFIGEAVDVTGWLGGYNFQWAWASGVAAGEAVR